MNNYINQIQDQLADNMDIEDIMDYIDLDAALEAAELDWDEDEEA